MVHSSSEGSEAMSKLGYMYEHDFGVKQSRVNLRAVLFITRKIFNDAVFVTPIIS